MIQLNMSWQFGFPLRFKNSPYTFSVGNVLETQKIQLIPTFIFSNPANPAKFSLLNFKTQLTQLNPAYNISKLT